MNGQSKFSVLAQSVDKRNAFTDEGVDGKVQESRLQAELDRKDEETEQRIKEIKAKPINKDFLKKEAQANLESSKYANKRGRTGMVQEAEDGIEQAKLDLKKSQNRLEEIKESAVAMEVRENLNAEQKFDTIMASIDDTDRTIELQVDKVKAEAKADKMDIEIQLGNIKTRNKVQEQKVALQKELYDDINNHLKATTKSLS